MVKELLPASAEGDLAAVCSWPDEIRRKAHYHWSSVLHYVDTPDFFCNYNYSSKFELKVFSVPFVNYHAVLLFYIMVAIVVFMSFKIQKHC